MPKSFYKEQKMMLDLHLVWVTIEGRFTISIEQTIRIGHTKYNI